MPKLITVISPTGKAEKHTLPNARDLVVNAGWSFEGGRKINPVDFVPAAVIPSLEERKRLRAKPASQEIFDRYGSSAVEEELIPEDDDLAEVSPELRYAAVEEEQEGAVAVVEEPASVVEDDVSENDDDIETAPTPRRGRPRKNA